ncbi:hypothetical protein IWQ62_000305 [Dispira parvispora]|uniref:ATP-dependent (S)-NAD(P)H-hydrate dehydratase n=1 Tax=Dispira parvispora TaxID=1520584 RepID=A0A9W8AUR9_9FUNG|nr:hypothetical protein IWQ62_000305 [Dispira parvispora]
MAMRPALETIKHLIPPLSPHLHKGQAGRIGVIGGSEDYTGAPYFSGYSSLLLGSDMCHVICDAGAAVPIKSYSPDLMVHPYLRKSKSSSTQSISEIMDQVTPLLSRLHVLVVGPGLSRDDFMLECAKQIILKARERSMPIVIDADALCVIQKEPSVIQGYTNSVLTPNVNEFRRLCEALNVHDVDDQVQTPTAARRLSQALGGVTILQKGPKDLITNGETVYICDVEGGLKRCGGQGDILSGTVATFLAWGVGYQNNVWSHEDVVDVKNIPLLASYVGCCVTRDSSRRAYAKYHRSTTTKRILSYIQQSYEEQFEKSLTD